MKRLFKVAGYLAALVLLFFIVVSVAFYHLTRTGDFRRYLIDAIEQQTGLKVQLGEADLEIGRILGISFRDVALADSDLATPQLSAERVTARVALWPLLNRHVVFYEVRVRKPDARLVRDHQGKIPFLERLFNLPFLNQHQDQFTLDLRTVRIADGSFEFIDHFAAANPVNTRFHDVTLVLKRAGPQVLQEILRQWVRSTTPEPRGPALEFEVAAGVERNGELAEWRAQGKLIFAEKKFDLTQAWCDIDTRISGTSAAVARIYSDKPLPVKKLGGSLDSRLRLQGNPRQRLSVTGTVDFEGLLVDAPELFANPLDAGDGRLQIDIQRQPQLWTVSRIDYRSGELAIGVKGEVRPAPDDTHLQLNLTAKPLPLPVFKKYFPVRWLVSPAVDTLLDALTEGDLIFHKAGVNATAGEIRHMMDTGIINERLWFDAEIRKGVARVAQGYPPLRALDARIRLDNGRIAFDPVSGIAGQTRLSYLQGSYDLQGGRAVLQLRARGEADLGELREQAERGVLPADVTKVLTSVKALEGKSTFDLGLTRVAGGAPEAEGKLVFEGARLQWDAYELTDIEGALSLTPAEINAAKVRAMIQGSPVEIRLAFRNYLSSDGTFDVAVRSPGVRAGTLSSLLFDKATAQNPGMVSGSIRYRGSLADQQERKFTGDLELVDVVFPASPLLQPLRQLNGRISIDENGIDFHGLNGLVAGFPARASGRWQYARKPQLTFDVTAPNLDLSYLISQIDPESAEFYATLNAEGRVALGRVRMRNLEFTDFKSNVILDQRTWRFPNLTMRSGGSITGPLIVEHKPDTLAIATEPKLKDVPMANFLRWLEITQSDISGTVDILGKFDTSGADEIERKRNLSGVFSLKISDGTIHRMRLLVQLLNVLDLSRWFTFQLPDLSKQGIRFRAITGDFTVSKGVYYTENLVVDSDDLRMTGAGKIDVPRDEIDLLVAVRPFSGVDAAINYIPLFGRGIAAVKNSFLVASFNIKGRVDDPIITPAPLGTLSEWVLGVLRIPKSLIPFAAEEKELSKEAPRENPAAPRQ